MLTSAVLPRAGAAAARIVDRCAAPPIMKQRMRRMNGSAASTQTATPTVSTTASIAERLKDQIVADGLKLSPAGAALLDELKVAAFADRAAVVAALPPAAALAGRWQPVGSWSMKGTEGGTAVLSRVCWGLFKPDDLPVRLGDSALVYDAAGGFTIELDFTLLPPAPAGAGSEANNGGSGGDCAPPVRGLWQALGSAARDPANPVLEVVTMRGGRIAPAPGTRLDRWLAALHGANPGMRVDDGRAEADLPAPMVASREILYVDPAASLLVQLGSGSHGEVLSVLVRRDA